jgi:hypothetical protein
VTAKRPRAEIVQVSQQDSTAGPGIFGIVEMLTYMPLHDASRVFTDRLSACGIAVTDEGIGSLNQAAAD